MKKALAIALTLAAGTAFAAEYKIDPHHTNVRFAIDHFETSTNRAGIYNLEGTLQYDPEAQTGSIDITIPVKDLTSGNEQFDKHLKSADILDAEKYPEIRFVSDKFAFDGKKLISVSGDLTLHGQTHPVTLTADKFNCYDSPILKAQVCGGDFTASLDRTQWGVDFFVDKGMAKDVNISVQLEAAKQ